MLRNYASRARVIMPWCAEILTYLQDEHLASMRGLEVARKVCKVLKVLSYWANRRSNIFGRGDAPRFAVFQSDSVSRPVRASPG
jgi:hypothetical protein